VAGGGHELPDVELVLPGVRFARDRLAAYARVCALPPGDTLPATAPHLLAFPLHMALMTDGAFPFPAVGLVHVRNRITCLRAIEAAEPLDVAVHATPAEPHPRGRTFTLVTSVAAGGEPVWEEHSTMLRRDGSRNGGGSAGGPQATGTELRESAVWGLPEDLGRRYAGVSGDHNPIHLHPLGARLFGFPRTIAHGMWTKARCLAELGPLLPESYTVEVSFRKPVLLPSEVAFAAATTDRQIEFAVRPAGQPDKVHLEGRVSW